MSAQSIITELSLRFFYFWGGWRGAFSVYVFLFGFALFSMLASRVQVREISFQRTRDRAGLSSVTVIMNNLSFKGSLQGVSLDDKLMSSGFVLQ